MAKQRRARSRPALTRSRRARPAPARQPRKTKGLPPPEPPKVQAPEKKSTYLEAVAVYERGVEALQRRDFFLAAARFREVLERYPDERELHERARLYLRVCERELQRQEPTPQTAEERVYAATLALNAGRDDEAFGHLSRAVADDPSNGTAHYMLAVVLARRGDSPNAIARLRQAVEFDPENRALARRDQDFDSLRDDELFRQVVNAPLGAGAGRRRARVRSSR